MGIFGRASQMANQFMPQIDAQTQGAIQQFATMPTPQRKGLFGRIFGNDPAGKLGGLASGLARAQAYIDGDWGAAEGIGQGDRAAQLAEQQRRASLEDWMFKERWERANPAPAAPNDTERDYQFMVQTVGEGPAKEWLRRRGDPLVNMTLPNGQFYSGPQSGLQAALGGGMQAPSSPTTKTIGGKTYQNIGGKWYEMGGGANGGTGNFPGQ